MDFQPFQPPPSDHHALNAGLGTEGGVSAKGLVDGVNSYFKHIFETLKERAHDVVDAIDGEARERLTTLEDTVASMQIKLDAIAKAQEPKHD